MRYSRFETVVLVVGGIAILGSIFFSLQGAPVVEEVIAQLLLLGVLIAAVHWGRNGGFIAASIASIIYIILRIPLVIEAEGLTSDIVTLILVRVLAFGLVGVVGGELCSRIKYIFAKLEDSNSIDDWSQFYNQRFVVRALETAIGQYDRYETPFSVVTVGLDPELMKDLRVSKQRSMVRGVANHVRNDIRLVDEAGRLEDGTFIVILPHTPREGGEVVVERLGRGVRDTLGAKDESVKAELFSAPHDMGRLQELRQELLQDRSDARQPQSLPSST
jgi:GGDEF domain-containing protein